MGSIRCNSCEGTQFTEILNLGEVPIAHRFHREMPKEKEFSHPLSVHLCEDCGLIQILNPIQPEELYRNYNFCFTAWKEQPQMLREINLIRESVGTNNLVVEVGSNDGGFLNKMKASGLSHLVGVEPNPAGCSIAEKIGVPIREGFFDSRITDQILKEFGKASLVVSRQVVEHISDLNALMKNINRLLKEDGWVLFEVPDFEMPMEHGDCSALWEEHVNYFTEPVLSGLLNRHGFTIKKVERYPFSGQALMVLAQRSTSAAETHETNSSEILRIKTLAKSYAAKVELFKRALIHQLETNRSKGGVNVLYGTGCRANSLVNGFKIGSYFDFVVDDQPEKQGMLMPGCLLKIRESRALYEKPGVCYLSVNHENEEKVMKRHEDHLSQVGNFYSLNAPSPLFEKIKQT